MAVAISAVDRSVRKPPAPGRGCACIARADADDSMPGNLSADRPRYAFGEAVAADCATASKETKRIAINNLGMKPKHVKCRCSE